MKPQEGYKSQLAEIQLEVWSLLRKDEWFAQNKVYAYLRSRQNWGVRFTQPFPMSHKRFFEKWLI